MGRDKLIKARNIVIEEELIDDKQIRMRDG